jgi:hypothetical protein
MHAVKIRIQLIALLACLSLAPLVFAGGKRDEAAARATIAARFEAALHGDVAALDKCWPTT